ncbi:unnamed protein product [Acanthoscelides obtectus]|uniref:Uncharacterized protein n=1 Tax=Acanthoscelides obtectus TaxID=200917 RepID=A0A9P0M5Q0_ACAOB|nr:unnamed protein product [Acanthoscelides obtectus]CAK1624315.1 hypothetical protein AOBTE_LOCUS2488 [Acanthoscelides obtectus]
MLIRKYLFCLGLPVLAHAGDMVKYLLSI